MSHSANTCLHCVTPCDSTCKDVSYRTSAKCCTTSKGSMSWILSATFLEIWKFLKIAFYIFWYNRGFGKRLGQISISSTDLYRSRPKPIRSNVCYAQVVQHFADVWYVARACHTSSGHRIYCSQIYMSSQTQHPLIKQLNFTAQFSTRFNSILVIDSP